MRVAILAQRTLNIEFDTTDVLQSQSMLLWPNIGVANVYRN